MRKRATELVLSILNGVVPVGSKRRKALRLLIKRQPMQSRNDLSYQQWIENLEPKLVSKPDEVISGPIISLVVPCFNTPERYIKDLVVSLKAQGYQKWQLCLADGSTDKNASKIIEELASTDKRIHYEKLQKNYGISGNTNRAIEHVKGKYVAFLDHDDILPPWALQEVAKAIKENPKADIFYSDEDRLSEDGKTRLIPLFKPDWSIDLFLGVNYPAHFLVMKNSLLSKLDGLRSAHDGSQDFDLILRSLSYNPTIIHIPKVLYHMRMAESSTGSNIGIKSYVHDAGVRALEEYFRRHKIDAKTLDIPNRPTNYHIKYAIKNDPLVSIIIPFKDKVSLLKACLKSIDEKNNYKNYEIILISNNSQEKQTHEFLDSLKPRKNIHIYYWDKPFNYSAINNYGRKQANGQVLAFLNNDTEVINKEWLEELVGVALQKDKGAVGPLLLYPDGTIQHAGVVVGMAGAAGHIFRNLKPDRFTYFCLPDWPRNYLAVTGACLVVGSNKFDEVGGFDEDIVVAGSDVTLCLKLHESGYLNVYWPFSTLTHHESKSVVSYKNIPPTDYDRSIARYRPYMNYHDPYYSPNLDLDSEWPKLRSTYE